MTDNYITIILEKDEAIYLINLLGEEHYKLAAQDNILVNMKRMHLERMTYSIMKALEEMTKK